MLPKTRETPTSRLSCRTRILDVAPGCRISLWPAEIYSAPEGRAYDRRNQGHSHVEKACQKRPSTYDDWGPEKLNDEQRRDLLEIIEDRYEKRSTIVTSQVPVDHWYDMIGNPTLADAILDRLVHSAYRIELSGESLRKLRQVSSDT